MLYAHWEGLIERLAESYLEFVRIQRLKNCELSGCMPALVVRSKFRDMEGTNKLKAHIDQLKFLRSAMEDRPKLPYRKSIRTESNLTSTVFAEILSTLGLSDVAFAGKFHLLDHSLLAKRNSIAHGQSLDIDVDEYLMLHAEVTGLCSLFRNELENVSVSRLFQQPSQNEAGPIG